MDRWSDHVDVAEWTWGVVGEWLANAMVVIGTGDVGINEPE
jgi:hypothetical protein